MKKLSELHPDTMLVVNPDGYGDGIVLDKESFLLSSEYVDRNPTEPLEVYIAGEECASFSFKDVFENIAEDMHEDWLDAVITDMELSCLDVEWIESQINQIFNRHPSYYTGEIVDVEN